MVIPVSFGDWRGSGRTGLRAWVHARQFFNDLMRSNEVFVFLFFIFLFYFFLFL